MAAPPAAWRIGDMRAAPGLFAGFDVRQHARLRLAVPGLDDQAGRASGHAHDDDAQAAVVQDGTAPWVPGKRGNPTAAAARPGAAAGLGHPRVIGGGHRSTTASSLATAAARLATRAASCRCWLSRASNVCS